MYFVCSSTNNRAGGKQDGILTIASHHPLRLWAIFRPNKSSKISMIFWTIRVLPQFWNPLVCQLHFLLSFSLASSVSWLSLAARSPCCALNAIAISILPLPHIGQQIFVDLAILFGMSPRWKLIFDFLPRAIEDLVKVAWR